MFGQVFSAYKLFGFLGITVAFCWSLYVAALVKLSLFSAFAYWFMGIFIFLSLASLTKVIVGREYLSYYRYFICFIGLLVTLSYVLQEPILLSLDIFILGIGLLQAFGRIGCLMVGCCYGKPTFWGVSYRESHVQKGFPQYLADVRLIPVQAIESLLGFGIFLAGNIILIEASSPGCAAFFYLISYSIGRYFLDFLRGDPGRLYLWGFSEAQWTSLILTTTIVCLELLGILNSGKWSYITFVLLLSTTILVALKRWTLNDEWELLSPRHICEVAKFVKLTSFLSVRNLPISGAQSTLTYLRIKISFSAIYADSKKIDYYIVSKQGDSLSYSSAQKIVNLILQLKQAKGSIDFFEHSNGIFHLLIYEDF